jgi:hypothetical protein
VDLLANGARLRPDTRDAMRRAGARRPMRVRSGSCGGIDVVLADGTYVNCPVDEPFAERSPYELTAVEDGLVLRGVTPFMGHVEESVTPLPAPAYYDRTSSSGEPLSRLGQVCSDRLGIGLTNRCVFWKQASERCRFCSIGLNGRTEHPQKHPHAVAEVADAAFADPIAPARHILLGGGTPNIDDAGAVAVAAVAADIRRHHTAPIYAMLAAPADPGWLNLLAEAGVDEVAINVEVFDDDAAAVNIPGKRQVIDIERTVRALDRAVSLFGPVHARSIVVVGLELRRSLLDGVAMLASRGVMPILSPLRPLRGTPVGEDERLAASDLWAIACDAARAAAAYDMPLGPTCIACQSNTLTVPGHPLYRFY